MRKSKEEVIESVLYSLQSTAGITELSPGSIARALCEVIVEEFYSVYEEIDFVSEMAFVSTAKSEYLGMIGELLDCKRNEEESDSDYRARIVNQVYVVQSANVGSLRIKALQVNGVANVEFEEFTNGPGSFTCYVTPESYPIRGDILNEVERIMREFCAYGVRYNVIGGKETSIEIVVSVLFKEGTLDTEKIEVRNKATRQLIDYVNRIEKGNEIVLNEIVSIVMRTSPNVFDVEMKELKKEGIPVSISNIRNDVSEKFILTQCEVIV